MGNTVADLFIRAFERTGSYGGRPVAEKWTDALIKLESLLRVCPSAKWHHFPQVLTACPWCAIEKQTGVRLFGQRVVADRFTGTVDVGALWQAILAVQGPGPDPSLPSERPWHAPSGMNVSFRVQQVIRKTIAMALVIGGLTSCNSIPEDGGVLWALVAYVIAYVVWPHIPSEKRAECELAHRNAKAEWENAIGRWKQEASQSAFRAKTQELELVKRQLVDLPGKRQRGLANLEAERRQRQLERYLDRFRIDRADIPGIGSSRTSMLASYGIETASDITKHTVHKIPGFGHKLTSELLNWRKGHEQNFSFNPNEPVNPRDIDALDRELNAERANLVSILRQGPEHLRRLSAETSATRSRLMPLLERCWHEFQLTESALKNL
jgi:DNA-binding helix-hairpin-helix protein with protein kinase domain